MPAATTPAAPNTPAALLAAWEATTTPAQLTAQAPHRAVALAWLTALHQLLASAPPLPGNVDMDDLATVLRAGGAGGNYWPYPRRGSPAAITGCPASVR